MEVVRLVIEKLYQMSLAHDLMYISKEGLGRVFLYQMVGLIPL